jgi:hypothetical protein
MLCVSTREQVCSHSLHFICQPKRQGVLESDDVLESFSGWTDQNCCYCGKSAEANAQPARKFDHHVNHSWDYIKKAARMPLQLKLKLYTREAKSMCLNSRTSFL